MLDAIAITIVMLTMSVTEEAELKSRVLQEYPTAITRLEAAFRTSRGVMKYNNEASPGSPEQLVRSWRIDFAIDGHNRKLSCRRIEGRGPYERVLACNQFYQFLLLRDADDAPLLVRGYVPNISNTAEFDDEWRSFVASGINAPFSIEGYSLIKEICNGDFKVDHVSEVERDGHTMLKIEYHTTEDETRKLHHDRWVLVSPRQAWVIHEWGWRIGERGGGRPFVGRVEYEGSKGGVPIPKRVVSVEAPPFLDTRPFKRSFEIGDFQFKKTPDKEFTLTYFGLPEMGRPTKQGLNLFGYGFVAVGCVLIALAAAIKYRAARR